MSSRKDYIATAEILNDVMGFIHPAVYSNIVKKFAEKFESENILFSKEKFISAVYQERV